MSLALWNALNDGLRTSLDSEEYQVWIAPLRLLRPAAAVLTLGCPNAFHRTWIRDNYLARMKAILGQLGQQVEIKLELLPTAPTPPPAEAKQLELPQITQGHPRLNQRFVFDTFVAGSGNEFAWAAAKAMAQGQKLFANTLFLVSGTGLGKSHLTQAVGHQVLAGDPRSRVAYLTAEDFANQMIAALRNKRIESFKDRFRRACDVLLLEEVQFLAGKEKTQDELGYTLDALLDSGKRIVFTGSCPPSEIKGLKRHLSSRLSSGIFASIEPPDHITRVRILEHMAQQEGVVVDTEVLEYLAQEVAGDVRRLQSAFVGLAAKGSLTGRHLDLRLAAEVLGHMHLQLSRVSPEQILSLVAQVYGIDLSVITGKSRKKTVTRPRNLALYLCRRHTEASYASLGRTFNRDHSTVMYNVDQVERNLGTDAKLGQELSFLEQRLGLASA